MRVFIAEDEILIAFDLQSQVEDFGAAEVVLANNCEDALVAVDGTKFDFALLDLNLGKEQSLPVADKLLQQGVPFAFLSGADRSVLPERFADCEMLTKPCPSDDLRRVLEGLRSR